MKKVYLCGPIASRKQEDAVEWRDEAKKKLHHWFDCLDPMRRPCWDGHDAIMFDKEDIRNADILLVNYNCARQYTTLCGTAMEVFYANSLDKFIVAFSDLEDEQRSPWMKYHCTTIQDSLDEAIKYIRQNFREDD